MAEDRGQDGSMEEDGESILSYLVPQLEAFLADEDLEEVIPFGVLLREDEEIVALEADLEEHETPSPEEIFTALCAAIREQVAADDECRAAAVCADVHVVREDIDLHTDAVRIFIETRAREALNVFLPYVLGSEGGVELGEMFAVPAEPLLFPAG